MESLFIYIAKASGLFGMFYIAYYLLLRKETFFTANRWFLLVGLLTSVIFPWIVFTTIVWVEPTPALTPAVDWSKIHTSPIQEESFEINWYLVLTIVYAIGTVLFLIRFVLDFYQLNRVLKGKTFHQQADHKFIDIEDNIAPFSYFNTIVYNSSLYSESEMESILEHEKVHSEQYHTIDVLITRLFCILFWFNPFIWLYKKAILQNLEFIADSEASKNIADKKAYQLTLLKITTQDNCVAITNHFYQSLIKKRIFMLNKNQSKKWSYWKYVVVLPLLGAFLFFFQVKVVAQEKESKKTEIKSQEDDKTNLIITKNTTDKEIKEYCEQIKRMYNIDLSFFNINRNLKGEIINIESKYKDKTNGGSGTSSQFKLDNNTPIKPFKFFYDNNEKVTGYINLDLNTLSKGKEIIIDGTVSSQDELAKLDLKEIKSLDAAKIANKPTILVTTNQSIKKVSKDISSQEEAKNENKVETSDKVEFIITKNTTDEEIKEKCQQIKEAYNINLTFYNIKRNSNEEITHIECKDEDFLEGKTNIFSYTRNPIEPFKFYNNNNNRAIEGRQSKVRFATLSNSISRIIDNKSFDYKKAVILIDGKLSDYQTLEKVNPKEVRQVIISDIKSTAEENKKYAELYGEKALYGILIQVLSNDYFNKNN
jgi:ribosomal protein L10